MTEDRGSSGSSIVSADFAAIGDATIALESSDLEVDPSLKLWRVAEAPVKLLTLEVVFDLDESAAGMLLQISSRCDLGRDHAAASIRYLSVGCWL
jgi:hypothetical protein